MGHIRLNSYQQKLVEENHKLIYWYMNKYNLSNEDTVDWYGILAEQLCRAAYYYDEERGKFSTLVYTFFSNKVQHVLRKLKETQYWISLNDIIEDTNVTLESVLSYEDTGYEYKQLKEQIREIYNSLPEKQKRCVELYFSEELTQKQISTITGISRQTVCGYINQFKKKVKKINDIL